MASLKVAIIDLIVNSKLQYLYSRFMAPAFYSIMPQVIAVWAERLGHQVYYDTFTGKEDLLREIPDDTDVLFVSSFTKGAYLAYALSNYFRKRGIVTVLGGPHARAYSEDALHYFDYVFGLTDEQLIQEFFANVSPQLQEGIFLSAQGQPKSLPGVRERWRFICHTSKKSKYIRQIGLLGSLGCPYTCDFCVDARIKYQPLPYGQIAEDLRFIGQQDMCDNVAWYDPNFAVRFDDYMNLIEEADLPRKLKFAAESSLSLLTEDHVKRLKNNNFLAILPGVESWFDYNDKSKQSQQRGQKKMEAISDQLQMISSHIPYVQVNFIFGGDADSGEEPFELTKRFVDRVPQVHPSYNLMTSFGNSAPMDASLRSQNRVIEIPYPLQDAYLCPNVIPKNYSMADFLDHFIDLIQHSFSCKKIAQRFFFNKKEYSILSAVLTIVRGISWRGPWGLPHYKKLRDLISSNKKAESFFFRQSDEIPEFLSRHIIVNLGDYYPFLPDRIKQRLHHACPV